VRCSSIADGLLSSSFCLRDCKTVMLTSYITNLIPKLVEDTTSLMPDCFICQQNGAPAHCACNARLVTRHCNDFIAKHAWPPNSPYLNMQYCVIIMCGVPCWKPITSWTSKPSTTEELQTNLDMIWNDLPQKPVARNVKNFRKRLQACVFKAGGHFKHSMWLTYINVPSNPFL